MRIMPEAIADILKVPLNTTQFRRFRGSNAVLVGTGLFLEVLFLPVFAYSLCGALLSPGFWWWLNAFLSFWLVVFLGLATVPAWQLASLQAKILKQNEPAIVADHHGIQDNASNYALGFIPWAEIEAIVSTSRYAPETRRTFLGVAVVLKNKEMLLRKKPKLVAMWMVPDDEIMKKRQVFIPQGRIAMPVEDVVEQINNFRARITQ